MADYLEGHLPLEKRALFDAHLDDCGKCLGDIRDVQRTVTLLRSLPDPELPVGFSESVMRLIDESDRRTSWIETLREAFALLASPRVLVPASVGMIALGIVVGTGQVEEALRLDEPREQFSAESQSVDEPVLAGIPGTRGSSEARGESRTRPISTIQITIQPNWALNPLLGPVRMPSQGVAEFTPVFPGRFSRDQLGFGGSPIVGDVFHRPSPLLGRTGVLRVAAPSNIRRSEGLDFDDSTQAQPIEKQPTADEWLARLRRNPEDFAALLSASTLAEQELWVANLARHAIERGEFDDIIASLRASPSEKARLLAEDFAAIGRGPMADGSGARNDD